MPSVSDRCQHLVSKSVLRVLALSLALAVASPVLHAQDWDHLSWRDKVHDPADNDEDSHHGREDKDKGIRAEIAALKAQVADLQSQVNSLQTSNATLQKQLAAVQSNHALLLGPFVTVDPNPEIGVIGPNIIFSGANIHIVSGSGSTDDGMLNNPNATLRGLGNLIIGYDEDPGKRPGGPEAPPPVLGPGDRSGSHNLVIGRWNRFTKAAFGGLVAGEANIISNEGASVSGGFGNTASGFDASVVGGAVNTASGFDASVIGGQNVTANNHFSIAPQPPFP